MTIDLLTDKAHTVQETAEFLGTTEEAVLSLIKRNELPASNINTKPNAQRPRWRILASDIGKFMLKTRQQSQVATPKPKRTKAAVKDYFK